MKGINKLRINRESTTSANSLIIVPTESGCARYLL